MLFLLRALGRGVVYGLAVLVAWNWLGVHSVFGEHKLSPVNSFGLGFAAAAILIALRG